MVDFNPAKEAIKTYNSLPKNSVTLILKYDGYVNQYASGVSVFRSYADETVNKKSSVIVDFEDNGKQYRLCDHDGDGNFDSVTIHSDKGRNIDQYFDEDDDGTFDRHSHSDTKGNHYVEHRAKWYNPMTWFKHNE